MEFTADSPSGVKRQNVDRRKESIMTTSRGKAVRHSHFLLLTASILALLAASALPVSACGRGHEGPMGLDSRVFDDLEPALKLTETQKTALTKLREQTKQAFATLREDRNAFQDAYQAELAKPEPNLRGLLESFENRPATKQEAMHALLEARLDFYDSLSADQKKLVIDSLRDRHEKLTAMREHQREHRDQATCERCDCPHCQHQCEMGKMGDMEKEELD